MGLAPDPCDVHGARGGGYGLDEEGDVLDEGDQPDLPLELRYASGYVVSDIVFSAVCFASEKRCGSCL